ncbi:ATP-binding cassette domain-containing protein [Erythrobacter aquimaris]|uniref:ATP-binding cassette domain-containing protein n=1 Tax=Qipengyuania aquimaris TaxID=255984 RepID=A0A6I4TLG5_9SPHN|nr:ABC transporter ATP-binding protein [Qipengyuania aquimaris]MXO96835.1 ATP-binding cassette domain-containing protein [Qipengyuania aquimaris]
MIFIQALQHKGAAMVMRQVLDELRQPAMRRGSVRMLCASLLAASTEGIGFVLLVPLLASLDAEASNLPLAGFASGLPLSVLLALFVALVGLRAGAEVWRVLSVQDVSRALVDSLRMNAVQNMLGARWRWLSGLREGEAEALLVSDIDRCAYAVEMLATLVRLALALAALLAAAIVVSPPAALVAIAGGLFAYLLFAPVRRKARMIGEELSARHDTVHTQLSRTMRGLRVIKSFGKESEHARMLENGFSALRRTERAYVGSSAIAQAILQVGGGAVTALAIWVAVTTLSIPLPTVLVLTAIFVRALPLIGQVQAHAQGWAHASPAFESARKFIGASKAHADAVASAPAPEFKSVLSLRDVGVRFAGRQGALSGIDLDIASNRLVVICGPSGSGKSTLADICSGLTFPDSGTVAINGIRLELSMLCSWRSRTAYVQQEAVIFGGTVRDNLRFADAHATEDQMWAALEEAHAGFVRDLPDGLDCPVGATGRELSGGEKQRIALARALLRSPDLIILDEATSALDSASEKAIAEALRSMTEKTTVIAIAHRGILPKLADQVIRLERGGVVAP